MSTILAFDPGFASFGAVAVSLQDPEHPVLLDWEFFETKKSQRKERRDVDTPAYVIRAEAGTLSGDQIQQLRDLIAATKTDEAKFLAHVKVESLEAIPAAQFETVRQLLLAKRRQVRGAAA